MEDSFPKRCPECQTPLNISTMRSTRSENLVIECPTCGYTAFPAEEAQITLRKVFEELRELISQLQPFNAIRVLRDPRHPFTDKLISTVAKVGSTILDYRLMLSLVAFFSGLLGSRKLAVLMAWVLMTCMVLHRDIVRKRIEERVREGQG